jgi:hypothetical protein
MRSALPWATIFFALAIAGPAVAGEPEQAMAKVAVAPAFPDDGITGSIDQWAIAQPLPLSDEQRGLIFLGIINLPDTPDTNSAPPGPTGALPENVDLHDLPAMLIRRIPLLRDHKFVKLEDRILVVRPSDRTVVSEIPRYRLVP